MKPLSGAALALLPLLSGPARGQAAPMAPAGPVADPVPPVVLSFPDAAGPPLSSCKEDLARAAAAKAGREYVPPEEPVASGPVQRTEPPDVDRMRKLVLDGTNLTLAELPGADPDAVPPQPIEGPPEALEAIGAVLRRAARDERVRLTFYGASHTSADWWTGELRRQLQDRYGDDGHGFIFPAAIYRGYRGQDLNLCRTEDWRADYVRLRTSRRDGLHGMGGASLSSSDPLDFGWLQTTVSNPHGRRISHVDLYSLGQPGGGTVVVQVDDSAPQEFTTDRPAHELLRHRLSFPEGAHRVRWSPKGDGEVRLLGASAEREGNGVIVDAIGIRGREARTWLEWDPALFGPGLASLGPDLVVLAYGTNEANDGRYDMTEYAADLDGVLTRLRTAVPEAACLLVGPSDRGKKISRDVYAVWDRTRPVAETQKRVAFAHGCGFWDWQAATGGEGSMVAWSLLQPPLGAQDLIHFSREGYIWSAHRLLDALDALADSP